MTRTPGDVGMCDLRQSGRGASASRANPIPPPPPSTPATGVPTAGIANKPGAGLSRWAPSKEPPAA